MNEFQCERCPDYHRANPATNICEWVDCTSSQIILKDGTCQDCEPNLTPSSNLLECITPTCPEGHKYGSDGSCIPCQPFETVSADGTKCI